MKKIWQNKFGVAEFNDFFYAKKALAEKSEEIYSSGKSPDSPRSFGFGRTRKIN